MKELVRRHPRVRAAGRAALRTWHLVRRPAKLLATVWYRLRLGHCGRNVDFETRMVVRNPHLISIGDGCSFSAYVVLDAHDRITIGDNCMFALRVTVATATHDHRQTPMNATFTTRPVVIGSDVWFGVGSTVLPGVVIGDGAVIGAHALVNRDVPPGAIVGGVPARVLRMRGVEGG
jgi:acetyltransferase-like isoleucine patch superfamily enzyme